VKFSITSVTVFCHSVRGLPRVVKRRELSATAVPVRRSRYISTLMGSRHTARSEACPKHELEARGRFRLFSFLGSVCSWHKRCVFSRGTVLGTRRLRCRNSILGLDPISILC
jgi:hypothetical protein